MLDFQTHSIATSNEAPKPFRVLIVDDSSFDRARVRRFCEASALFIDLEEASDIAHMEAMIAKNFYDAFVLDYRLPVGNGLDALKILRENPQTKNAAIMMVTRAPTEDLNMRMGNSHLNLLLRKQDLNPRSMRALLLDLIARFGEHTAPKDRNDLRRQDRVAAVKSDGVSLDALFDPFGTYSSQQNRLNLALKMIAKSELLFE